jgi:hypothetical protein
MTIYNTACGNGYNTSVCPVGTTNYDGDYEALSITGGLTANLSAPTSGVYKNILYMQDRTIPIQTHDEKLTGSSTSTFTGTIYVPRSPLIYSGGSVTNGISTALIAWNLTFTGTSYVQDGLNGPGNTGTSTRIVMVE